MKIAGRTEELHIFDVRDEDRKTLVGLGYEFLETDICDNEIWCREDDFFVGTDFVCSVCKEVCHDYQSPEVVFHNADMAVCENCSIDYEEVDGVIKKRNV